MLSCASSSSSSSSLSTEKLGPKKDIKSMMRGKIQITEDMIDEIFENLTPKAQESYTRYLEKIVLEISIISEKEQFALLDKELDKKNQILRNIKSKIPTRMNQASIERQSGITETLYKLEIIVQMLPLINAEIKWLEEQLKKQA